MMKEAHKRNRNPKYKQKYRVTNWSQYEQSLRNRGNLTIWLSPVAIKSWTPAKSNNINPLKVVWENRIPHG